MKKIIIIVGLFIMFCTMQNIVAMLSQNTHYQEIEVFLGTITPQDYLKDMESSDIQYGTILRSLRKSNLAAYDFIIEVIKTAVAKKPVSVKRAAADLYGNTRNTIDLMYARLNATTF